MTMHVPGSDQRADLRVVRDDALRVTTSGGMPPAGPPPEQALALLENARRVADATVAEARDEAERLLAAARERAAQVQRDARELGERLRGEAERESAQVRHQAFGEAERIVADARAQVSALERAIGGLEASRDEALSSARRLVEDLSRLVAEHQPATGAHHQG